jgi:hypothetical protein
LSAIAIRTRLPRVRTFAGEEVKDMFTRRRSGSAAQVIVLVTGVVLLAFGVFAIARGGLSGPVTDPIVQVLGFDHTPLLGVFEAGIGALLVLGSLSPGGRRVSLLLALLLVVGGVLILGKADWAQSHLSPQAEFGWIPIIAGSAVIVAVRALPHLRPRRTLWR